MDVPNQQLVAATWFEQTAATTKAAMVAALGGLGSRLLADFRPVLATRTP